MDQLTSSYGYILVFEALGFLTGGPVAGNRVINDKENNKEQKRRLRLQSSQLRLIFTPSTILVNGLNISVDLIRFAENSIC